MPVATKQIVAALHATPLRSVDEIKDAPAEPGFYAWWCDSIALPGEVPEVLHETDSSAALLYVGIAPNSATSSGNLGARLRKHRKGTIGSSTFRRGLTALLWEREGWRPIWATDRPALENIHLAALSEWQRENLRVQWAVVDEPWSYEAEVIAAMQPPMNLDHNYHHEFHATMKAERARFKEAAECFRDRSA